MNTLQTPIIIHFSPTQIKYTPKAEFNYCKFGSFKRRTRTANSNWRIAYASSRSWRHQNVCTQTGKFNFLTWYQVPVFVYVFNWIINEQIMPIQTYREFWLRMYVKLSVLENISFILFCVNVTGHSFKTVLNVKVLTKKDF